MLPWNNRIPDRLARNARWTCPCPTQKPSVLFLVCDYLKKAGPQSDFIAYRPAPRLARIPRRLARAQGKVISAFSSYIPIFENR